MELVLEPNRPPPPPGDADTAVDCDDPNNEELEDPELPNNPCPDEAVGVEEDVCAEEDPNNDEVGAADPNKEFLPEDGVEEPNKLDVDDGVFDPKGEAEAVVVLLPNGEFEAPDEDEPNTEVEAGALLDDPKIDVDVVAGCWLPNIDAEEPEEPKGEADVEEPNALFAPNTDEAPPCACVLLPPPNNEDPEDDEDDPPNIPGEDELPAAAPPNTEGD